MPLGKNLAIGSEEARRQRAELRTSYGNKLSNKNLGRSGRDRSSGSTSGSGSGSRSAMTLTGSDTGSSLRRIASSFAQVSDVNCGSNAALPHEDSADDVREEFAEVLIRSEPFAVSKVANYRGASASKAYSVSALIDRTPSGTGTGTGTETGTGTNTMWERRHRTPSGTKVGTGTVTGTGTETGTGTNTLRERRHKTPSGTQVGTGTGTGNNTLHNCDCSNAFQTRASERWGQIAGTVSTLFRVRRISQANPLSELRRLREQRDLLEAFTRPFLYEAEDGAHTK
ncbi:hypothetical protein ACLKA6_016840 [Drosophila palustris]